MMYSLVPLLLMVAMIMPWLGPSDPGDRIAAAAAADGLAEQGLIYHQAALAVAMANPGMTGAVTVGVLPDRWSATSVASCAKANLVATYMTVPGTVSAPAVAEAMARLWGGYPLVGQSVGNKLTNPFTGAELALPCAIPNQTPVIVSQVGG
jgi:hypothetical protein